MIDNGALYLEVVNRGEIVHTVDATVLKPEKEVLVILAGVSHVLTNQHEIGTERSEIRF